MNDQKLKWPLIASLILNLFLIGGVASGAYHLFWSDKAPLAGKGGLHSLRFAADKLSTERQNEFNKILRDTRQAARPLIDSAKDARTEVRTLLAATNFDRTAINTALAHVREADTALRIRTEESLVNFAESLSPEERQKLAEGLARRGPLRQQPDVTKDMLK